MSFFFIDEGFEQLSLTQKGYGHLYDSGETADLTMSYASVDSGSAPAADDLIVWLILAGDGVAQPIVDLTGSGWAQWRGYDGSNLAASVLAKVAVAGDISGPAGIVSAPTLGSIGFWAAYTVSGSVTSLSVATGSLQLSAGSAPTNQTQNSSAIGASAIAITIAGGGGNDDSPSLAISGATADINFTSSSNQWFGSATETQFMVNKTTGGASITFSKGDDGSNNHMASSYVTVS